MSKVSIIVPVYNAEKYLHKCLCSIRSQTMTDFECLIINDGSSDSSQSICEEFIKKDSRFKLFTQSNLGVSAARNLGLDNANSDWVTFIDADDYVSNDYLDNFFMYNNCQTNRQIIQGYYCSGYYGTDIDTLYHSIKYTHTIITKDNGSDYLSQHNLLYNWAVWCKIFSMDIINKHGLRFNINLQCGEDGLFWHNYLCYIDTIIYIPAQGYTYFCPKQYYNSLSRASGYSKPNELCVLDMAENYCYISKILISKFSLSGKAKQLLMQLYINNYFKALLKYKLSNEQLLLMNSIKPSLNIIPISYRNILLMLINILPVRVSNALGAYFFKSK